MKRLKFGESHSVVFEAFYSYKNPVTSIFFFQLQLHNWRRFFLLRTGFGVLSPLICSEIMALKQRFRGHKTPLFISRRRHFPMSSV